MPNPRIRRLTLEDFQALNLLEQAAFAALDRQSPRSLRYLLTRARADAWGSFQSGALLGAVIVLYRHGSPRARLYSIATDQHRRQAGLGRQLLAHAERQAVIKGRRFMRAEVRENNHASQALFERAGYQCTGRIRGYYDDGMDARRYEKSLEL